jgi:hypothetical protein
MCEAADGRWTPCGVRRLRNDASTRTSPASVGQRSDYTASTRLRPRGAHANQNARIGPHDLVPPCCRKAGRPTRAVMAGRDALERGCRRHTNSSVPDESSRLTVSPQRGQYASDQPLSSNPPNRGKAVRLPPMSNSDDAVNLRHNYADGVLRTNEEWEKIRAAFARKHAMQDARPRKMKKPRQPNSLF